jgi:hypothetical protein
MPAAVNTERRVAMVIGNSAYELAPLKNPVNDARDIAHALTTLGFEVSYKEDLNQKDMKRAIREFGAQIRKGGVGLFYYAGHGVQVNGVNYLIPVDAKVESEEEVEYECVDAGFVLAQMESAGNTMNIMILDACRNNPFARSFRSPSRGLAQMKAPSGTLIAYATAPGSVASDGNAKNGIYTQELLKSMLTPNLSIEEFFKRVRISVRNLTQDKQTPWESSSLTCDFYFNQAGEVADAAIFPLGTNETEPIADPAKNLGSMRGSSLAPDEGAFNGGTYTNKFFSFTLTFPVEWTVQGKEMKEIIDTTGKHLLAGDNKNLQAMIDSASQNSFHLLTISKFALGAPVDFNPMLLCLAERVSLFPGIKRGSDYLFNVRRSAQMGQVQYQFGETYTEKIGGVEFDVLPANVNYGTVTVKQKFYATIQKGFALGFIINYNTDEQLHELTRVLQSAKFQ